MGGGANVLEGREGCFGDGIYMLVEGEDLVKDDVKISDVRQCRQQSPSLCRGP